MALSKLERRLLANQYRIMGLLDEEERDFCKQMEEALENGFSDYYKEKLFGWMSEEMSPEESAFVRDALDVHGVLQHCYEGLDDKGRIEESRLAFPGFDGNHEGRYLAYADFLRTKEERFDYVKLSGFDGLNSHAPFANGAVYLGDRHGRLCAPERHRPFRGGRADGLAARHRGGLPAPAAPERVSAGGAARPG